MGDRGHDLDGRFEHLLNSGPGLASSRGHSGLGYLTAPGMWEEWCTKVADFDADLPCSGGGVSKIVYPPCTQLFARLGTVVGTPEIALTWSFARLGGYVPTCNP